LISTFKTASIKTNGKKVILNEKHLKTFLSFCRKNPVAGGEKDAMNGSTFSSLLKAYGGPFWFSLLLRLIADGLLVSTPLILGSIIRYVSNEESTALWKGLALSFLLFLVSFIQPYLNGQYYHNNLVVGYRIRGGLMAAIYRKALRVSGSAKKDTTVGEIVNLMAVDANRFFDLMPNIHMLWSGLLLIGVLTYLLFTYIGYAVFVGFFVALMTFPLSFWIAGKLKVLQIDQMQYKDERVKSMNEILSGMKVLKLYAWEPSFEKLVMGVRKIEMRIIKKIALYNAITYFNFNLAPFIIAMVSFITYVLTGGTLDAESTFVSLALFNLFRFPMTFCE
jgi:ATP-binding cassette subfamily C (CFTR/MRP) protein 1